jgi:2-polyprenyl-6-methoxyphenol hydroxylase-like FAD-dependent oxidoreductase
VQSLVEDGAKLLPPGVERVVFGRASRAILHHVGGGRLFWAAAVYGPEGSLAAAANKKELLLRRFQGWEQPIEAAIDATPEEAMVGFDIYDRPPVARWSDRRATLLGDAAHAMTTNLSQGGCQAIEDAVVLARCLSEAGDVEAGLRRYEAERIPRTAALVKRSYGIARAGGLRNPIATAVRDRIFGLALGTVAWKQHRAFVAETL